MRILVINYRYFVSGGPERYLFNLKQLLESNGHHVVPFSIGYAQNESSPYARFFVPPVAETDQVFFHEQRQTPRSTYRTLERSFYSREVYDLLRKLIDEVVPDCAIVLHYLRKLSPSVLVALHDARVPFAVRLSDFGMVCANQHLYRGTAPCDLCVKGGGFHSIRFRCVHGSLGASAVAFLSTAVHRMLHLFDLIPAFLVPSSFMLRIMVEGGIPEERMIHLPTMTPPADSPPRMRRKRRIVFGGRIDPLKGVDLLLDALRVYQQGSHNIDWEVKIAGPGNSDYVDHIRQRCVREKLVNVELIDTLPFNDLAALFGESLASTVPSLWYDNMPNAALESLACGTPVVAPNHGSFPEIIRHGETGLLYSPGDATDLARSLRFLIENPEQAVRMGFNGRQHIEEYHSPASHYRLLLEALSRAGLKESACDR